MKNRLMIALFLAVVVSGCASKPLLPETPLTRAQAEAMIAEGKAMTSEGESKLSQGKDMVKEGKKLTREGKDLIETGEDKIERGERLLKSAELLEDAEKMRLKGQGIKDKIIQ